MTLKMRPLIFFILLAAGYSNAANFSPPRVENPQLQKSLENFLNSDTEDARRLLRSFTREELLEIFSAYRQTKSVQEQRYLWLIEEFHEREADRVAAERLWYVFLAVTLLMTGIFTFSLLTYFTQRKLTQKEND